MCVAGVLSLVRKDPQVGTLGFLEWDSGHWFPEPNAQGSAPRRALVLGRRL